MRRRARTVATFGGRQLGWVAGVAAIVLALLALGVAGFWPLTPIDRLVDRLVGSLRGGSLYDLMLVVTALGDGLFLTLVAVVTIASFLFTGARWRAMCYTLCFGSMPVVVHTIKLWIARPRPSDIPYTGVDQFSFPSSHVAHSALIYGAVAGLTFVTFRGWMRWSLTGSFLLLVAMIGVSRIYLGAHWFSDVLAGYALAGLFLVMLAIAVAKHPEPPRFSRAIPITLFVIAAAFPIYLMISLPDSDALYRAIELHQRPGTPAGSMPSP
ncbi:PA-phosphatase-like phosphoesterase [Hyphomonas adhaerens MHS-3]|uniref:PA-phosphatase-like phosphoesterase n=1 Tax=Hyphomonas adhaerens MHS-3 TaxID=1280949 RepID=A0A069E4K2_9PROT|nr:phosphatase PAP2 family protein [Hyphomonas adhaerens]KCZ85003.1 PA-phosphatase-like phosphoesterase [Hyphomonas adhaerens MHS-3]